jgi:hypothetical protein
VLYMQSTELELNKWSGSCRFTHAKLEDGDVLLRFNEHNPTGLFSYPQLSTRRVMLIALWLNKSSSSSS